MTLRHSDQLMLILELVSEPMHWLFPKADDGDDDAGNGVGDVGGVDDAGDAGHPLATQPSSRLRMTEHV